jgi:hypothetical protein
MLLKAAASLKRLKTVLGRVGQRNSDTQSVAAESLIQKTGSEPEPESEPGTQSTNPRHQGCQRGRHSFQIYETLGHMTSLKHFVAHHSSFLQTRGSPAAGL